MYDDAKMKKLEERLKVLDKAKGKIFDERKLRWTIISGIPDIDIEDENQLEIGMKFDESLIQRIQR
jgi:hypothetical protein